jgi:hypothetical protein
MTRETPLSSGDAEDALAAVQSVETSLAGFNLRLHAVNTLTLGRWNALLVATPSSSLMAFGDTYLEWPILAAWIAFIIGSLFLFKKLKQDITPLRLRQEWHFWVYVFAGSLMTVVLMVSVRGMAEWPFGLIGFILIIYFLIQGITIPILIFHGRAFGVVGVASLGTMMLIEARIDLVPDRLSWLAALALVQMLIGLYLVFQSRAR